MTALPTRRVLTNSDLDAIVSAVLLKRVEPVGAVKFLPHERITDRTLRGTSEDIVVNMPYLPGCGLWFDHHSSNDVPEHFEGLYDGQAPSAARVVHRYYQSEGKVEAFRGLEDLLADTDKVDSAQFTPEDIRNPRGTVLVSFLIDSHPLKKESVAENQLMISLLDSGDPGRVLEHPVFKPRKKRLLERRQESKEALQDHLRTENGLMINDFRQLEGEKRDLCNDKFLPFVVYDKSHTLLRIKYLDQNRVKLNLGFNMFLDGSSCPLHFGNLLKRFGGGGHERAAGCSVEREHASEAIEIIKDAIQRRTIPDQIDFEESL